MQAACTAPGSRSTPLVLSLVRDGRLRCYSHLDERVAGFFAVGLAKASGLPVAVACTSGTAAVELAPAVYEAREARVPLVVLTADRPPELRDVGAGQTVDQLKLYGDAAKWFVEVGTHEATPARLRWIRTLACRAFWTATTGRRGPVHLNVPLREPLVLDEGETLPPDDSGRPGGRPWVAHAQAAAQPAQVTSGGARGVIVAGRDERHPALPEALARAAERCGYPLLADPLSGARRGGAAVAHYDALLRDEAFAAAHAPDFVLRVGDLPTSKPLRQWLAGQADAAQVRLDPEEGWQDPDGVVETMLVADPVATLDALDASADPAWLRSWRAADEAAATAIAATLGDALSEPLVAAQLGADLPPTATCFVASSMPVRDVETFWPARDAPPRALSHRGANGIDGTVSGALGAAAAGAGPVVLLIGDVALAYDLGALASAARLGLSLTIVLAQQRRRRDLLLPPRGPRARRLRGARRHPARAGLRPRGRALRLRLHARRRPRRAAHRPRRRRRRRHADRGAHRPRRERRAAPPRLGRGGRCAQRPLARARADGGRRSRRRCASRPSSGCRRRGCRCRSAGRPRT